MLLQDVRFALRSMRRQAGASMMAVLILALGVGATTAVFSIVNAVLLRPLPYAHPDQLVAISRIYPQTRAELPVSLDEVEAWRRDSRQLSGIGSFVYTQVPVKVGDQALSIVTAAADPELLATLGTPLALGTNFTGSGSSRIDRTAILSYAVWRDALGADPAAIGRVVAVDGEPYTIAGVLAERFVFPRPDASYFDDSVGLVIPVANIAESWGRSSSQWFAIGRLAGNSTRERVEAELTAISTHRSDGMPAGTLVAYRASSLAELTHRQVRPALLLIMISSGVLLLIACVNVMNLWFSRSAARAREMAIRKAIGAGSWRLVRQMLTESACLTFIAGSVGVFVARLLQNTIVSLSPVHLPVSGRIDVDARVLLFALTACAAAAVVSGLMPALHTSLDREHLMGGGQRVSRGRLLARIQRTLTVAQVALGLALLTAAALLVNSLWRLGSVDPGFRTEGVVGFSVSVPSDHPRDQNPALHERILSGMQEIPGVTSVGWITNLPPEQRKGVFIPFTILGRPASPNEPRTFCNLQSTSEDYFATLAIPIGQGRAFTRADGAGSAPVAIVNEAFAQRFLADGPAIGRSIKTSFDGRPREIVGVIRPIRDRGLNVRPVPTVYVPFRQFAFGYGSVAVRATAPAARLVPAIRDRMRGIDPTVPVTQFETLDDRVRRSLGEPRFYTVIAATCAGMAVLFVTLGLYAVIAFSVSRRTSEIGIRVAMGARRSAILRLVVGEGLAVGAVGAAIGTALSFALSRLLTQWLFGISPADPWTFAACLAFVLLVTVLASYVPARRASRVDPLVALRQD